MNVTFPHVETNVSLQQAKLENSFYTIEDEVRAASARFYSALDRMLNGDAGPLGDIWSHSATVTTMSRSAVAKSGGTRLEDHGSELLR